MLPGAFKASIAQWRKKKAMPPILWQHDTWQPLGVWTELSEDETGLKVAGQLALELQAAKDARTLINIGAVKGLSIGYRTLDYEIDRDTGARLLKKVDLWEISLVTFPMLPEAQITGVKSTLNDRELEQALRDEGLSHREAKLAVSVVRKQVLRDGGQTEPTPRDEAKDVLMSLRKSAERLR
jgi:HK97 family phage prohead protease